MRQMSLRTMGRLLVLPTGQVLYTNGYNYVEIYTPAGTPNSSWAPTITNSPAQVDPGGTNYQLTGTQFNGLSQAVSYGDDYQAATNYPLVRITNNATGHVFYARTHDHSTMAVATGSTPVSTEFDVPAGIEAGREHLGRRRKRDRVPTGERECQPSGDLDAFWLRRTERPRIPS